MTRSPGAAASTVSRYFAVVNFLRRGGGSLPGFEAGPASAPGAVVAVVVGLADQPLVGAEAYRRVAAAYDGGEPASSPDVDAIWITTPLFCAAIHGTTCHVARTLAITSTSKLICQPASSSDVPNPDE